jgi:GMP synthase (glutamine-hydrolysing)
MTKPVLCITHHAARDVGRIGAHYRARGVPLLIRQPMSGEALPNPEDCSRAIVFGGAMSANDEHLDGIAQELRWIDQALAQGLPMLGICLGAQMMARVLGGEVGPRADGQWEIGYRPLRATVPETPLPTFAFQWHGEGFEPPAAAEVIAEGDLFPHQAFRIGPRSYGVQFHPEIGDAELAHWHANHADEMDQPGADPIDAQKRDHAQHGPQVGAWLTAFLDNW